MSRKVGIAFLLAAVVALFVVYITPLIVNAEPGPLNPVGTLLEASINTDGSNFSAPFTNGVGWPTEQCKFQAVNSVGTQLGWTSARCNPEMQTNNGQDFDTTLTAIGISDPSDVVGVYIFRFTAGGATASKSVETDSHEYVWVNRNATNDWSIVAPPDPPITEFNEVAYYIPSTGFATTTGVTGVGAMFSITDPEYIEYFGYRIIGPNNEVLYYASTTASVEGLYEVSTPYDFDKPGVYQGRAFFAQDYGGEVWVVDNPTGQQIVVDVEEWTVNDQGQFTLNTATTSTTTLSNLTLDCGEGFAGSICNLVARIFIPTPSGIGLIQSAFGTLMTKAPFSFFVESKNILNSFRTKSTSSGGSFNLTLYGESVPIISTTTATSIGLGTSSIDFLKFLMAVGLWILLAWYLYWRIASIFGV
jgi:hypothetical protein